MHENKQINSQVNHSNYKYKMVVGHTTPDMVMNQWIMLVSSWMQWHFEK